MSGWKSSKERDRKTLTLEVKAHNARGLSAPRKSVSNVVSRIMDLQRVIASANLSPSPTPTHSGSKSRGFGQNLPKRGLLRFRETVRRIVELNRLSKLEGDDMVTHAQTTDATDFTERLIDYFLVFETELEDMKGNEAHDGQSLQLKAKLVEHIPETAHKDCRVQAGWSMMAFPRPPVLSNRYRPPTFFYSVFTQPDGSKIFATFLRYDEPAPEAMMKKLTKRDSRRSVMTRSNSVLARVFAHDSDTQSISEATSGFSSPTLGPLPKIPIIETHRMDPDCPYGSIRVRKSPDQNSEMTGKLVGVKNSTFTTDKSVRDEKTGQIYMRLTDGTGWVFRNDPKDFKTPIVIPVIGEILSPSASVLKISKNKDAKRSSFSAFASKISLRFSSSSNPSIPEIKKENEKESFTFKGEKQFPKDRSLLGTAYKVVTYEFNKRPLRFDVQLDSYDEIVVTNISKKLSKLRKNSKILRINGLEMPQEGRMQELNYVISHLNKTLPLTVEFQVAYGVPEGIPIVEHCFERPMTTDSQQQLYRPKVLAIVSHFPLFKEFERALVDILRFTCEDGRGIKTKIKGRKLQIESLIAMLVYKLPVPIPGRFGVSFCVYDRFIDCSLPTVRSPFVSTLPLRTLFSSLSVDNILVLLSALLHEERIVIHSHSLVMLTTVCESLLQLLYPLSWSFSYIPVLPSEGIVALEQVSPYLIGVASDVFISRQASLDGVYVVDLNQNRIILECSNATEGEDLLSSQKKKKNTSAKSSRRNSKVKSFLNLSKHTVTSTAKIPQLHQRRVEPPVHIPPKYFKYLKKVFRIALHMRAIDHDLVEFEAGQSNKTFITRFDRQVYAAIYHFYASLLQGYRRYLAFVDHEPFFNLAGFLETIKDPSTQQLVKQIIGSPETGMKTSFYVFLSEDWIQGPIHDYIDSPSSAGLDDITAIQENADDIFMYKVVPDGVIPPHRKRPHDLTAASKHTMPFSKRLNKSIMGERRTKRLEFERSKNFLFHCKLHKAKVLTESWTANLLPCEKVEYLFISIFKGDELEQKKIDNLNKILVDEKARKRLQKILTQPQTMRTTTCLQPKAFELLTKLLSVAVKVAEDLKDYETALVIWEKSSRFVLERKDGTKFHGEEALKDCGMWKDIQFWRAAALIKEGQVRSEKKMESKRRQNIMHRKRQSMNFQSSWTKATKKPPAIPRNSSSPPNTKKKLKTLHSSEEMKTSEAVKALMVEWMPRAIFKMVESGMEKTDINNFVSDITEKYMFMQQQKEELHILLINSFIAMEAQAELTRQ